MLYMERSSVRFGGIEEKTASASESTSSRAEAKGQEKKTYNSRYSLVVTHPTTNLPIQGLSSGERTGSSVFLVLWSYVEGALLNRFIYHNRGICCRLVFVLTDINITCRIHCLKEDSG